MDISELLIELYSRVPPLVASAVDGLNREQLSWVPQCGTNNIGWLGWHIGRVIDMQVADAAGTEQEWVTGDWADKFGLQPDPQNSGYAHTPTQVAAVRPEGPDAVTGYLAAVTSASERYLSTVHAADLDRVIDRRWDPPVTLGVRLVSIVDDALQHAGQASYLRGLLPA